jgi:hypothetical protein
MILPIKCPKCNDIMVTSFSEVIVDGMEKRCCRRPDHHIIIRSGPYSENIAATLEIMAKNDPVIWMVWWLNTEELEIHDSQGIHPIPFIAPRWDNISSTINRIKLLLTFQ